MRINFRVLSRVVEAVAFSRYRSQANRITLRQKQRARALFIDVSRVSAGYETGGIPRTVLEISKAILELNCFINVGFFGFGDRGELVSAHRWAGKVLGEDSCSLLDKIEFQPGDVVLGLDLSLPPQYLTYKSLRSLREHGVMVVSIVYDLMPIDFPNFFKFGKSILFWLWLRGVLSSNNVVAISRSVESRLKALSSDLSLGSGQRTSVVSLASFETRALDMPTSATIDSTCTILMVGTLEPRKGYSQALDVFESLWSRGLYFRVTIVGRKGWKCRGTVRRIKHLQSKGFPLNWCADASDEDLEKFYSSHNVLVANSFAEGFGLPLLEASRRGLHVIARDIEVFREVLPSGIFFRTDFELSEKIGEFAKRGVAGFSFATEYRESEGRTWRDVAKELCFLMGAQQLKEPLGSRGVLPEDNLPKPTK